jgi:hypothetical protein
MKKDKRTEGQSSALDPCLTPRPNARTGIGAEMINDSINCYLSSAEKLTITYLWRMIAWKFVLYNRACDADKTLATPSLSTIYQRVRQAGTAQKKVRNNWQPLTPKKRFLSKHEFKLEWHNPSVFLIDPQTRLVMRTPMLIFFEFCKTAPTSFVYQYRLFYLTRILRNHAATNLNHKLRAVANKGPQTRNDEHFRKTKKRPGSPSITITWPYSITLMSYLSVTSWPFMVRLNSYQTIRGTQVR